MPAWGEGQAAGKTSWWVPWARSHALRYLPSTKHGPCCNGRASLSVGPKPPSSCDGHALGPTLCPAKRKARICGLKFQTITWPSSEPEMSCFRFVLKATEVTASRWPRKERSRVGSSGCANQEARGSAARMTGPGMLPYSGGGTLLAIYLLELPSARWLCCSTHATEFALDGQLP